MTENFEILKNLKEIEDSLNVFKFLQAFENKLFIYSPSVEKIYLNYSFIFPNKDSNNIAILPNHKDEISKVHNIPLKYISKKHYISVMPADIIDSSGTVVKILNSEKMTPSKYFHIELDILKKINKEIKEIHSHDFYPILLTNGIRTLHNYLPVIDVYHLDLIGLEKDGYISSLDLFTIKNYFINGIKSMFNGDLNEKK